MAETRLFTPDWVSPPGETIADVLRERGLSQTDLAARSGFTRKHVNDLVRGRAAITSATALKLEAVLGSTAGFWLTRESRYREALARRVKLDALRQQGSWLTELPLTDMRKHGWVQRFTHKGQQVEECLRFFGVASVPAWRTVYEKPLAAYRKSMKVASRVGALAAWIRQGERIAEKCVCEPFDGDLFDEVLRDVRRLTLDPDPDSFIERLRTACARCGVVVVFLPTPAGCPASGATKWLAPDRALLMLSLRYKTNDHLWFSFFHEAAHLLLHGKRLLFLEGTKSISEAREAQADRFAQDILIPPEQASKLEDLGLSESAVVRFAGQADVAPGIVVGRMQREGLLPWTHLNGLKISYRWS